MNTDTTGSEATGDATQPELLHRVIHSLTVFEPRRRYPDLIVHEQMLLSQTTTEDEVFDLIDAWAEVAGYDGGGWMWGRRKVTLRYLGVRQIEILDPGTVFVTKGEIELEGETGPIRLAPLSSFDYTILRKHLPDLLDGTVPVELWACPTPAE